MRSRPWTPSAPSWSGSRSASRPISLTTWCTRYVRATIAEILLTLALTFAIVVAVTYVFLQDWRAALVPSLTIPVSLIGAFAVLLALGFSANTVTLFALILAIGLVVDDAIVVVENVQRPMQDEGLEAAEAARRAMTQVTGPIIATTLVLLAVFVPVALLPGLAGQLYRQFAVAVSAAVVISTVNALTLSPALCAALLRPPDDRRSGPLAHFAKALATTRERYVQIVAWLVRRLAVAFVVLALSLVGAWVLFATIPGTLLPQEDQGAVFVDVQLPEAASLERTQEVMAQVRAILDATGGVEDVVAIGGFSIIGGTLSANTGFALAILEPWDQRTAPEEQLDALLARLRGTLAAIPMAEAAAFAPPAIPGVGSVSGFDFRLQALAGQSPEELARTLRSLILAANQEPAIATAFSTFSADVPQIFVDLDRAKAETLGVPVAEVYRTLQAQLGSLYVNDFNLYDRVYQVRIQADAPYRDDAEDINRLYARSTVGRDGAAAHPDLALDHARARRARALQPVPRGTHQRRGSAGRQLGPGDGGAGPARRHHAAGGVRLAMVGPVLPGAADQRPGAPDPRARLRLRLPFPGRSVRELDPADAGGALGRSGSTGCARRRVGRGHREQPLCPDRPGPADRPCGQERDPDRRVREEPARGRDGRARCRAYRRAAAVPRCADDRAHLHPRRRSPGDRERCRRRRSARNRNYGVRRHAGGDADRDLPRSGALRRVPACCRAADARPAALA
jgi:AcrB/AcrD/AcrF family